MSLDSSRSTLRLGGLLIAAVLFLSGIGLFGVEFTHDEGHQALVQAVAASELLDEARLAQVTFKIQVQDWKNLLLRGQNPADYDKYLAQFNAAESSIDVALDGLKNSPILPSALRGEVASIRTEHARLGTVYRDALAKYDRSQPASVFVVDASIRGIDQNLTQRIDLVAQQILASERARVSALNEQFDERYRTLRLLVIVGTAGVLFLLALILWRTRPGMR